MINFRTFEADLREALDDFNLARTSSSKQKRAGRINDALCTIEELAKPSARLSNFCSHLLENSTTYQEAKYRLNEYAKESM
ncbi:hypothetical protein N040_11525 [Serratia marcescens EGD-HP20]|nr:hypothetical protein N040_11525 [Serratia marcescens EGD-HP20]